MINIKIDEIVYEIPEKWDDVSINKWRSLNAIKGYITDNMTDDQKFNIDLEIISILTDIPFDTLMNIPGKYYKIIMEHLTFYTTEKLKEEPTQSFVIDDKEYKLMPFDKMTLGDRANIDIIKDSDTLENRIGRVMSILYKYEGEPELDMEARDEKEALFNEYVSINQVYGTMVFFLTLIEAYTKNTKYSMVMTKRNELMKKMKWKERMKMRMKLAMRNITTAWRIGSQRGRSWILKKYLK